MTSHSQPSPSPRALSSRSTLSESVLSLCMSRLLPACSLPVLMASLPVSVGAWSYNGSVGEAPLSPCLSRALPPSASLTAVSLLIPSVTSVPSILSMIDSFPVSWRSSSLLPVSLTTTSLPVLWANTLPVSAGAAASFQSRGEYHRTKSSRRQPGLAA